MLKYIIAAFVLSLAAALILGRPLINTLRRLKFGQKILQDGPTWHADKENTPTMGGFIFIGALFLTLMISLPLMIRQGDPRPVYMFGLALVFGLIGFIDDLTAIRRQTNKGLSAMQKILLQIGASLIFLTVMRIGGFITSEFYIPFVGTSIEVSWPVYMALSVFIIVGTVNAVNLTDGIDGLCGTVTCIVSAFFALVFCALEATPVYYAVGLCGGLLGFLYYNRNPAKVFMGDTGSLFLGGAVCGLAFAANMPVILLPVGIIYVLEALSDIIQLFSIKYTGKHFFKMAPLHHHFEICGWSENTICAVFGGVTLVMCVLSYFFM